MLLIFAALLGLGSMCLASEQPAAAEAALALPMERTAYFVGEKIPIGVRADADVKIELLNADGRVTACQGTPVPIVLDSAALAPGDYSVEVNGWFCRWRCPPSCCATTRSS